MRESQRMRQFTPGHVQSPTFLFLILLAFVKPCCPGAHRCHRTIDEFAVFVTHPFRHYVDRYQVYRLALGQPIHSKGGSGVKVIAYR